MRLLLIRHGQSVGNAMGRMQGWSDEPLDDTGIEQATSLASRLAAEHRVTAVYASPLKRARRTAEIVAMRLSLEVLFDERLKELDCGVITGLTFAEIEERFPEIVRSWRTELAWAPVPGEEDHGAFLSRVTAAIVDISARHAGDGEVAIVAHGGTLSAVMAGLLHLDYSVRQPWAFGNASLSIVDIGGLRPRVLLLNDRHHWITQRGVT